MQIYSVIDGFSLCGVLGSENSKKHSGILFFEFPSNILTFVGYNSNYMSDKIQWLSENVSMPIFAQDKIERWLECVAQNHNRIIRSMVYIFCDDEKILEVNKEFLNHDYYTDIITFDYCQGRMLRGDIYISLDTVKSNAESLGLDYESEFYRVIAHGLLHLCGINDKGPGEREIMEAHEDEALKLLSNLK